MKTKLILLQTQLIWGFTCCWHTGEAADEPETSAATSPVQPGLTEHLSPHSSSGRPAIRQTDRLQLYDSHGEIQTRFVKLYLCRTFRYGRTDPIMLWYALTCSSQTRYQETDHMLNPGGDGTKVWSPTLEGRKMKPYPDTWPDTPVSELRLVQSTGRLTGERKA